MAELTSPLCFWIFLLPALTACLILLFGKSRTVASILALAGMTATFVLSAFIFLETQTAVLTWFGGQLRMDALSGLICGLIGFVGFLVIIYSGKYLDFEKQRGVIPEEKIRPFYAQILLFIGSMLWATTTNNIIMLWVIIEATTLASALLVAFYWNREALEAGYKYLMLLTVGISFGLFGCVLFYSGAAPHVGGEDPLKISVISAAVAGGLIPRSILLLAVAFFLVSFGTKAGMAPFHAWLPDAHAEAPTPVSALLSGVMIKIGIYALIRTIAPSFAIYATISHFVVIMGIFTMLIGITMMFLQEDIKRFLAYSSVSQMGYILMGFGLAGWAAGPEKEAAYLGMYGSLFHLVNHGIIKALLFMGAGAVVCATGLRRINELGGLGRKMPVTSFCFFIAGLAISGVPLLNGFMSKFTIFLAGAKAPGMLWTTIVAIIGSILTLAAFVHVAYKIFLGPMPEALKSMPIREVPFSMSAPIFLLCLLCFLLGTYPQILYPMLDRATRVVLALISRGGP